MNTTQEYRDAVRADLEDAWLAYGTDRAAWGHNYAAAYAEAFASMGLHSPRMILEVGVGHSRSGRVYADQGAPGPKERPRLAGAGLRAWRDVFPTAQVLGFDLHPYTMLKGEPRISTYLCDVLGPSGRSNCPDRLMLGQFDLVVDDASHSLLCQLLRMHTLFDFLRLGGLYVIEDVDSADVSAFRKLLAAGRAFWSFTSDPKPFNEFKNDSNIVIIPRVAGHHVIMDWLRAALARLDLPDSVGNMCGRVH